MKSNRMLYVVFSFLLAAFALLTLFLSGSIVFDLFGIRELEGNYVPFVVWANLVCSLLYLPAAYGMFTAKNWTPKPLYWCLYILAIAFIGLLIHILVGGLYETKTIGAMIFRMAVTYGFYFAAKKQQTS